MHPFALLPLASFVAILFAAAHITAQNRRSPVNLAFLALSVALGGWALVTFLAKLPLPNELVAVLFRITTLFWIPVGVLWLFFIKALLGRRPGWVTKTLLPLCVVACGISLYTDLLHTELQQGPWGPYLANGPLFAPITFGLVLAPLFYGFGLLVWRWRRESHPVERKLLGVLWIGACVSILIGAVSDIILPVFFTEDAPQIAHMVGALFALVLWYTVRRYNLRVLSLERAAPDVFASVHEGVILVAANGRILQANPAAEARFGPAGRGFLAGRPVAEVIPGYATDGAPPAPDLQVETVVGGRTLSITRSIHREANEPVGDILLIRDVTERKRAEETLRQANEELERRVAARTRELEETNRRLQTEIEERVQAESALIRSERLAAVGTLAGGMAHEFNNINVSTLGFAELALMDNALPEESRDCLERIRQAALRARGVTQNLLAYAGAQGHVVQTGDLLDVIEESVALVRRDFETDGVSVRLDLRRTPPLPMDRDQIGQVLVNLLINARHALLDRERREIIVRAGSTPAEDPVAAWFSVEDNGCGIPPDAQSRIFTPFYTTKGEYARGETAQARVRGTGLGLAVCHTIIARHGGEIRVESTPGEGATFTVRLPLRTAPTLPKTSPPEQDQNEPLGAQRILVLDDEADVRDLLAVHLGREGFKVFAVDDGEEAIRHLKREGADLVLLDLKMPRMSGEAFLQRLHDLPAERCPAVLIVTGKETGIAPLVRDHTAVVASIRKPFELVDLTRAVRRTLGRQRPAPAGAADGPGD